MPLHNNNKSIRHVPRLARVRRSKVMRQRREAVQLQHRICIKCFCLEAITGEQGVFFSNKFIIHAIAFSDNAIGDSATFPTGQLGKRNRAVNELHRPSAANGQPLHNQLRRMRISTGLATYGFLTQFSNSFHLSRLAKAVPLAVGVTASPILSHSQHSPQCSGQSSPTAKAGQNPVTGALEKRPPPAPSVRQVLGCLPKRISLPENLEFQPQMLLNLKQSIHVEKQLTW